MSHSRPTRRHRRGFTIMELMVVIIIIALIIAIVVPALGKAREAARQTASMGQMTNILNACSQFQNSERRLPGYFSAKDMGHSDNMTRGMSTAENVMLDLSGGPDPNGPISVGPLSNSNTWVKVDPKQIGVATGSNKTYYTPDAKYFVAQANDGGSVQQQFGVPGHTDAEGKDQLPDLVDAFGSPLMLWMQDDTAINQAKTFDDMVRVDSQAGPSRFYWASNAAFLMANSLGKKGADQTDPTSGSLIGPDIATPQKVRALAAVVGNPAFPYRDQNNSFPPTIPAAARGTMMICSAGIDGVYFGRKDRGASQFSGDMAYMNNFSPDGSNPYLDEKNNPTSHDVLKRFDDIVMSGGN